MTPKDNSTLRYKVTLRRQAITLLAERGVAAPVVMETHGGMGVIYDQCYAHLEQGVVFEKSADKAARLGRQRPTWAVYEADCIPTLAAGVGGHLTIDLLDTDPWGCCWDAVEAFFSSDRPFAPLLAVAIFDGVRENLEMGTGWKVRALQSAIERHGNDLHPIYLDVCRELLTEKAARAGYSLSFFSGFYAGRRGKLTHCLGLLERG